MCGIVGYVGDGNPVHALLSARARLEDLAETVTVE